MAAKLLIQQGGVTRELSAQDFNSVQYDTQAGTRYELLDDYGNVIRDYTTRVENGKLLIDVAGTSASPDFILNNYTSYFPAPASGGMGSGYFGTAAAESVASTAVKASTVGSTGGSGLLVGGLVGLAAIGGIAAAASGGSSKDKDKDNTANSGSQATPSTNTNTGNQAVPSNTDKNTAGTNNTSPAPSNNSGSQNTPSTDKNTGSTNTTNTAPNNTGSQTASNTNTDKNTAGTNTTSTTPSNNSGGQTAPNTNTDKNTADTNTTSTTPSNNSGSQNPVPSSTKDVLHGNSIKLPTAYTHKLLSGSDLNAITKAAADGTKINQYQSSEANKKIIINDLNNLSREVQTELSLFVAQLLNPIRKQWHVGTLKVTDGSMNFAQDVANEYTSNNVAWGTLKGHYVQGITKAAAKYGLNTGGQYYENIGWYGSQVTKMTLDDLKKHLYDIVVFMLFDDARSNHGHAKSLLNAMNFHNQDLDTDYFGVDTSNIGKEGWNLHLIHATNNDAYVTDRTTFAAKIQTPEITAMPTQNTASANTSNTGNGEAALGLATVSGVAAATNQDQNTGSQTAPNTNTDKNTAGTNTTSTTPNNNSDSQTPPSTNTDKNTGTNNTAPTDNSGSQNPATPSTKDILHGNSIKLPTAYTHKVLLGEDMNAITQAAKGGEEMNRYQSNAENKKIIINDLNNLSREVQTELSLFMAQLLNPIRQQWGVATYKVTEGAMNFAQDVANEYTDNKQSLFALNGHYVPGIQRAAAKYGLNTGGQYYENAGARSSSNQNAFKNITLDDLKSYVYNSIVGMLFNDAHADHGHAKALLNAMPYESQNADTDYLGVDTSSIHGGEINMHFIESTDNDAYVTDRATFAAKIQTPEITSMPATKTSPRMVYLDDDNSHLSTTQFGESDDSAPQITQKFTFSQLLEGNVRQLADEYDENDVLALSQNAFSALNKDQSNLHEHISYDSATGLLSYDADGVSGSISPVAFAQLAQGLQQEQIQFEIL